MKIKLIISIIFILSSNLLSQSADDYYHSAAQSYIKANYEQAKQAVAEGIAKYPNDPRLAAIAEKLKNEEEKQNQQQEQQEQEQEQQQQQEQEQQKQEQQEQEEQQQQEQQQQQQQMEEMSKEDAERILDALKEDEKDEQKKRQVKVPANGRVLKDW